MNLDRNVSFMGPQNAMSKKRTTDIANNQTSFSKLTPKYLAVKDKFNIPTSNFIIRIIKSKLVFFFNL